MASLPTMISDGAWAGVSEVASVILQITVRDCPCPEPEASHALPQRRLQICHQFYLLHAGAAQSSHNFSSCMCSLQ